MKIVSGFSILERIILVAGLLVLVFGFQLLVARERRVLRDAERLSIVRQAEAVFGIIFVKTGSFEAIAENGCSTAGSALSSCNVSLAGVTANMWRDPGKEQMTVATVPDRSGYTIRFVLESGYGGLSAGEHTLTAQGIR